MNDELTLWALVTIFFMIPTSVLAIWMIVQWAVSNIKQHNIHMHAYEETEEQVRHKQTNANIGENASRIVVRQLSIGDKLDMLLLENKELKKQIAELIKKLDV